jgi:hypothetical protein
MTPSERILLEIISRMLACMEAIEQDRVDGFRWMDALERAGDMLTQYEFRRCRVCGCSQIDACPSCCGWAEEDLCTACTGEART